LTRSKEISSKALLLLTHISSNAGKRAQAVKHGGIELKPVFQVARALFERAF
jgi:hypothetical protein